ncbi:MAG: ABC transporter permease [Acidimicrobiales bacterium]
MSLVTREPPAAAPGFGRLSADHREALRSPLLLTGAAMLGLFLFVALAAPLIAPFSPRAISGPSFAHPSTTHLLGTDGAGGDIASQVIWGTRTSMTVAVAGASLAVGLGIVVGVGAAMVGGIVDTVAMRVIDMFLALPGLVLAILVVTLVGPSQTILILVVAQAGWPQIARVLHSQTLTTRERGFVGAARSFGGGPSYLVRRHLAPAIGPLIVARWVDWAGVAVVLESGLAFLGLGDPVHASWGTVLDHAFAHQGLLFTNTWVWWVVPAALAITALVIAFSLVGIGLEPLFNPRWARGSQP